MSQSFIIASTVYIIVMVLFHIVKDVITPKDISPDLRVKVNKRWLISTGIGLIILYLLYGREGP